MTRLVRSLLVFLALIPAVLAAQDKTTTSTTTVSCAITSIMTNPKGLKAARELMPFTIQAVAYDSAGNVVPATFTYAVGDPNVAQIGSNGNGNTWSIGSTAINVSVAGCKPYALVPVDVTIPIVKLTITPENSTIGLGSSERVQLMATWGDGMSSEISGMIASSAPAIASIDNMRNVTGVADGQAMLNAVISAPKAKWSASTAVNVGKTAVKTIK